MSLPSAFLEQTSRHTWITISSPKQPPMHIKCHLSVNEIAEILSKRAPEATYKYEPNDSSSSQGRPITPPELSLTLPCAEKARRLAQVLRSNEGAGHSWFLTSNDLFRAGFELAATVPAKREDDGFFVEVWEAMDRRLFPGHERAAAAWESRLRKMEKGKKGKEVDASQREYGTSTVATDFLQLFLASPSPPPSQIREAARLLAQRPSFPETMKEVLVSLYKTEGVAVPKTPKSKRKGKGKEGKEGKEEGERSTEERWVRS